ncbi:MAG: LPS assembly lipoprotein LptE [Pseudomonadota bacterium]
MRTLCLLAVLSLSACGFGLAGSRPLPDALSLVYIDVQTPYSVRETPIAIALRSRINRRGGLITGKASEARATLRLSGLSESRAVLSIGPDSKAVEFRLSTSVSYQLLDGRKILVEPDTLAVSRDYSFTAQQVLSKEAEEDRLRVFIQEEMAELLMLRLESKLRALQAIAEPAPPVGVVPVPASAP